MIQLPNFKSQNYNRPSDVVDPSYKDTPEWHLAWHQFMMGQHCLGVTGVKNYKQDRIKLNRDYGAGEQSSSIYKTLVVPEQSGPRTLGSEKFEPLFKHNETMLSVDFEKFPTPLPKIIQSIQSIMENTEHEISVSAVDENSTSLKKQLKWQSFIEGANKPMFDYIKTMQGVGVTNPIAPKSLEEMEMMEKIGSFKLAYEIAIKDAITLTENASKIKKIKRRIIYDLVTNGEAATFNFNDIGGVNKQMYIDFADLIIEDCDDEDYSRASYGSLLQWMTIVDIRAESGLGEKDLEGIARKWTKQKKGVMYGTERRDAGVWYDGVKVPVFIGFYKSLNEDYKTYLQDGSGRIYNEPWRIETGMSDNGTQKIKKYITPKFYDESNSVNRKTEIHGQRVLYTSKWIPDTKFVFGHQMVGDMPFDYFTKDVKLPFMLYRLPGKPMVENMIPIADDIVLTWLNYQNAKAKAPPDGLRIELASITNLKIGAKTLHPLDVIKIYTNTGILLHRIAPLEDQQPIGSQNPIDRLEGGYNSAVMSAANAMQLAYNELNRISGIADIAVGGNPKSEQGLGVSKIALDTTNQTLGPIYTGWITMKENNAQYTALKIHSAILAADGMGSPYYEMLGPQKFNAIKGAGPYPPVYWGINIVAKVDEAMKQKVVEAAQAALGVGKDGVPILSYSEYLYVIAKIQENCNLDDIRAYISFKETQAKEAAAKQAQDSQMLQIQGKQATDQQAAQAKLQEAQLLSDLKIKEDTALTINKARLLIVDYTLQQELATSSIRAQADVDNAQLPGTPGASSPQPPAGPQGPAPTPETITPGVPAAQ